MPALKFPVCPTISGAARFKTVKSYFQFPLSLPRACPDFKEGRGLWVRLSITCLVNFSELMAGEKQLMGPVAVTVARQAGVSFSENQEPFFEGDGGAQAHIKKRFFAKGESAQEARAYAACFGPVQRGRMEAFLK